MAGTRASFSIPRPLLGILASLLPIAAVCSYFSGMHDLRGAAADLGREATLARLQPVAYADAAPAAAKSAAPLSGQQVYESLCVACHGEGVGGAPRLGDKAAWAPRIARGYNMLLAHAIEGFNGKTGMMPPRGGGSNEDVEVARAVAYLANKAGASFKEPASLPHK